MMMPAPMQLSRDQLMERLGSALEPDSLAVDKETLEAHRIDGVLPLLVVTPHSEEHVRTTLRICIAAGAPVFPWGGGTAIAVGNPPRHGGIVIKLHRLNRVIEHDSANLTVTAQCGVSLRDLQATIAGPKQFVPIDAPYPARATIGGVVAANLNGPRRGSHGSVRDLVIGMKVVLANGEQVKAGGKVVKNVAGYDMCKLFIGSLGTLGVITELTLRVAPLADSMATFAGRGELGRLGNFHRELLGSTLIPSAIFLCRDAGSELWRIGVWCEGFEATVQRQLGELEALARRSGIEGEILRAENHADFWRALGDFPLRPEYLTYRITVPRAQLLESIEMIEAQDQTAIVGDMNTGTLWIACAARQSELERLPRLTRIARERRGHVVVFAAPPALKSGVNVWGESGATLTLMREIKHRFDPDGLLNPGRFVGNL
jgi:glycolate oxidase FAD binding subunit